MLAPENKRERITETSLMPQPEGDTQSVPMPMPMLEGDIQSVPMPMPRLEDEVQDAADRVFLVEDAQGPSEDTAIFWLDS